MRWAAAWMVALLLVLPACGDETRKPVEEKGAKALPPAAPDWVPDDLEKLPIELPRIAGVKVPPNLAQVVSPQPQQPCEPQTT